MDVRDGLGNYRVPPGGRAYLPGQLTAHDTGELIRRAGLAAGLYPAFGVELRSAVGLQGRLDWAWFEREERNRPKAAFILAGSGVSARRYRSRIERGCERLDRSGAGLKIIALFSVGDSTSDDPEIGAREKDAVLRLIGRPDVHVLLDQDLWEGIEQLHRTRLPSR